MNTFTKQKFALGILTTTICVSSSYELKDLYLSSLYDYEPYLTIILVSLSLTISAITSVLIIKTLYKIKTFRQFVNKRNSIEGFWIFKCATCDNDTILARDALGEVFLNSETLNYEVSFYRQDDNSEIGINTSSNNIIYEETTGRYINHFSYGGKKNIEEAIAYGKFFKSPGSSKLDRYEGLILIAENGNPIRQKGKRIKIDSKLLKKENWISQTLNYN